MAIQRTTNLQIRSESNLINSGSTMLNLACTDSIEGAFRMGSIVTIPGSTDSGKTMLAITTLACCANDSRFDKYDLIYDDVESKMRIDVEYLFGKKTKKKIQEPPFGKSKSIEDFEANAIKALRENKRSCIYILDTPDALTSDEETERIHKKLIKMAKSPEDLKNVAGTYAMEKAKTNHRVLREVNDTIESTNSLLIMLQQSRDKIDAGTFGRKTDTAGGRAPAHYSLHRIWMSRMGWIKSKGEKIGSQNLAQLEKNHYNGKLRETAFNIYYDYGIDNIGSIIDWLVSNEYWEKRGNSIVAEELNLEGIRSKIIQIIEEDELENELEKVAQKYWLEKEEGLKLGRKRRF